MKTTVIFSKRLFLNMATISFEHQIHAPVEIAQSTCDHGRGYLSECSSNWEFQGIEVFIILPVDSLFDKPPKEKIHGG